MKKLLNVLVDLALVVACLVMFGGVLLFGMYAPLPPNETMLPYMAVPTDEGIQQQPHPNGRFTPAAHLYLVRHPPFGGHTMIIYWLPILLYVLYLVCMVLFLIAIARWT